MDTAMESTKKKSIATGSKIKLALFGAVLAGLLALSRFVDIGGAISTILDWIESQGAMGAVLFILLYIVACVFVIPGSAITLAGGATYGFAKGFLLVSAGSTLGATLAFIIGRYLARDFVASKVAENKKFKAMDDAVAQQGWKIVFLTRLTPIMPFSLQNYGYGLTKVPLLQYMLASWIGMMPGTVLYVYIGTVGGQAAEGGASTAEWIMRGVALTATVVVTIFITRVARKALAQAVDTDSIDEPTA
jgi:uncharacterized membrane protein YdjX (TVP38/TMEM64 family)